MSKDEKYIPSQNRFNDVQKYEIVKNMLKERGVELIDIAKLTFDLQKPYIPNIDLDTCLEHVERVVMKREVQHAALVGLELDILAEQGKLSEPLSEILMSDYGLFGI